VSSRIVARVEWGALALSGLVCTGVIFTPSGWAVVPEWIVAVELTFALSTLTVAVLCSRRLWLWIGRRSLAITFVPNVVAALLVGSTGDEIVLRLRSSPSEGFLYSSGWMCSTNVDGVFLSAGTNDRVYVLQDYCIPDGPEGVRVYRRHGSSLLMQELDLASDWAQICEAWQSSRRWLSPPRFSRSLVDSCEVP
jgi:hypothetical protein